VWFRFKSIFIEMRKRENNPDLLKHLENYYKENPGVKFKGLYVNEEGVGMCQWDAPDTDSVKRFFDSIGETVDQIVAVKKIL